MRRLERWLHQHIFKVGWLLTKNLQTTTILYYTFFLPGVIVHEVVYWLVAGILNVRAERAIAWPEAQAIAELKLNFIRLARNTNRIKVAIISVAPLLSGLLLIWVISNNVLNLDAVIATFGGGSIDDIGAAVSLLLSTPDVWIWVYLTFTIASTMMPDIQALKGWRPVLLGLGILTGILLALGVAQEVFLNTLAQPLMEGINRLSFTFAVVIGIDLLMTGVLGVIEALIERLTGDSATFQNGKLVALTREEMLRQREQHRAKQDRQRQAATAKAITPAGPPSIYKLPLPIPGAPGRDVAEAVVVRRDDATVLASGRPVPTDRSGPAMIPGIAVAKNDDELKPDAPLQEARIRTRPPTRETQVEDETDEDEDDEEEEARL